MKLVETTHAGGFLASEARGTRSRALIIIAMGQVLAAGAILGKITSSGKYVGYDPAANDGSQTPAGVLWDAIDATDADTKGVAIVRDAEINSSEVVWKAGLTDAQKATGLTKLIDLGILDRYSGQPHIVIGATKLSFDEQPVGGIKATDLGPVTVRIENDDGTLIDGDNATVVTLAIDTGAGVLTGGGDAIAANGVVTWPEIQLSIAGDVTLKATKAGLGTAHSSEIVVTDA